MNATRRPTPPRIGEVWERDGRRREVVGVSTRDPRIVAWKSPSLKYEHQCYLTTWAEWVAGARRIAE